jgi:hypothetical protein
VLFQTISHIFNDALHHSEKMRAVSFTSICVAIKASFPNLSALGSFFLKLVCQLRGPTQMGTVATTWLLKNSTVTSSSTCILIAAMALSLRKRGVDLFVLAHLQEKV